MSCCNTSHNTTATSKDSANDIIDVVNNAYSARAREGVTTEYANNVAAAFGYSEEQLRSVPEGAHMGLSCGNPVGIANIKEGETILDLGSGGGIDVFLAASKVGCQGKAIGLDMSNDMIALARKNAALKGLKPPHVAFVQALLTEPLPIESNSVDCVLSNCVVNLLPLEGKATLLKEVHRILKPGGRVVISDIVAKTELPDSIKSDLIAYVGCISGAIVLNDYQNLLQQAGLTNVLFVDTQSDLSVYYQTSDNTSTSSCCTPTPVGSKPRKPDYDMNEWVASYQIYALKEGPPVDTPPNALMRWWDAYPVVQSSPKHITADEVANLIRKGPSADFAVIDVRRNDHSGGHVRGSHNWFAQTFYDDLPAFYEKFKDTPQVIFYCQSSNGRGPRSAGWYQDYLDAHKEGEQRSEALVLTGGIKNWLAKFSEEEDLVDRD